MISRGRLRRLLNPSTVHTEGPNGDPLQATSSSNHPSQEEGQQVSGMDSSRQDLLFLGPGQSVESGGAAFASGAECGSVYDSADAFEQIRQMLRDRGSAMRGRAWAGEPSPASVVSDASFAGDDLERSDLVHVRTFPARKADSPRARVMTELLERFVSGRHRAHRRRTERLFDPSELRYRADLRAWRRAMRAALEDISSRNRMTRAWDRPAPPRNIAKAKHDINNDHINNNNSSNNGWNLLHRPPRNHRRHHRFHHHQHHATSTSSSGGFSDSHGTDTDRCSRAGNVRRIARAFEKATADRQRSREARRCLGARHGHRHARNAGSANDGGGSRGAINQAVMLAKRAQLCREIESKADAASRAGRSSKSGASGASASTSPAGKTARDRLLDEIRKGSSTTLKRWPSPTRSTRTGGGGGGDLNDTPRPAQSKASKGPSLRARIRMMRNCRPCTTTTTKEMGAVHPALLREIPIAAGRVRHRTLLASIRKAAQEINGRTSAAAAACDRVSATKGNRVTVRDDPFQSLLRETVRRAEEMGEARARCHNARLILRDVAAAAANAAIAKSSIDNTDDKVTSNTTTTTTTQCRKSSNNAPRGRQCAKSSKACRPARTASQRSNTGGSQVRSALLRDIASGETAVHRAAIARAEWKERIRSIAREAAAKRSSSSSSSSSSSPATHRDDADARIASVSDDGWVDVLDEIDEVIDATATVTAEPETATGGGWFGIFSR